MGAPRNVVFVRHGESEANVLQAADKEGRGSELPEALRMRPDWMHRLTPKGVEQAKAAGRWLLEHYGPPEDYFDAIYCSQFIRARETASYLTAPEGMWRPHGMIHERDWGIFGAVPREKQEELFPHTVHMRKEAAWYARLDGGEALGDNVALRVRDFKQTLFEKWEGRNVLVVTHGDVIKASRYVFEEMLPEQWHAVDRDKSQDIGNCALVCYSEENPDDPADIRNYLNWRRMIQPDDLPASPFGGEWQEIQRSRLMSAAALRETVEVIPRLL